MSPQQQHCFCKGANCNDIDKCICSGDGMTTYANKAKNANSCNTRAANDTQASCQNGEKLCMVSTTYTDNTGELI